MPVYRFKFSSIVLLLFIVAFSFAQDKEDKKSPFKNLDCSYSEEIYTFHNPTESDSGKVRVTQVWREDLINELYDESLSLNEYSNSMSEISAINYSTKKKASEYTRDGNTIYYFCEEGSQFFDSDQKTCSFKVPLSDDYPTAFKLEKEFLDARYLSLIPINRMYNAKERLIKFRFPEGMKLDFKLMNLDSIVYRCDTTSFNGENGTKLKEITFNFSNTSGSAFEKDTPGFTYSQPHLVVITKSYTDAEGETQRVFSTVADQYAWYRTLIAKTKNNSDTLKPLVQELTKNLDKDFDKAAAIYYWVQDNIRYIAFERGIMGFKPDECQNVFAKKFGDCKGVANLAKQMLLLAGIDARLTWIGSSSISPQYDYSFPSLVTDNHMICTAIIGEKKYFLDPTESMRALGQNSSFISGKPVLIEDGENYIIDQVETVSPDLNQVFFTYDFTIQNEVLSGTGSRLYEGDHKVSMLAYFDRFAPQTREEKIEEHIQNGDKNITLTKIEYSDLTDRTRDLSIKVNATWENQIITLKDKMLISADLHRTWFAFNLNDRESDYWLGKTYDHQYAYSLEIPQGYKVVSLPEKITHETKDFLLEYHSSIEGNRIISSKRIIMKDRIFSHESFEEWEIAREALKKLYSSHIVLQKK
jgi:hypothetical protein